MIWPISLAMGGTLLAALWFGWRAGRHEVEDVTEAALRGGIALAWVWLVAYATFAMVLSAVAGGGLSVAGMPALGWSLGSIVIWGPVTVIVYLGRLMWVRRR